MTSNYLRALRLYRPISGGDEPATGTAEPETVASPLDALYKRHKELGDQLSAIVDGRREARTAFEARTANEDESQRPTADERDAFAAAEESANENAQTLIRELRSVEQKIEQEEALVRSREIAERASARESGSPSLSITHEPVTYREDNQKERSYFMDLAAMQIPEMRQSASAHIDGYEERLKKHAAEMAEILPKRWQERARRAEREIEQAEREVRSRLRSPAEFRGFEDSPFERRTRMESRAPSRIVGQGGYAIPPLWLIDQYIPALRPGRVAAGLARNLTLPEGTDSINIPRLLTPTLTAVQQQDAAPVASRDFSDTFQQANVKTIAGQEDVPIQLIEQAPGNILDRVLMTDLIADYNQKVDLQVITGNGVGAPLSGGQVVGLYPATNWGATQMTWNQTTPTQAEFFQVLGAMASRTAYSRFNLRDFAYLFHPRRWFWGATGLDTTNRFLVENRNWQAYSPSALAEPDTPFEGFVGQVPFGPNVYIDANVPINDNGSGAQSGAYDFALGAIWDDLWLFEGDLRTRVLSEVLSGTLELRFQVYGYVAFLARYGVSITLAQGPAFAQPYTLSGSSNGVAF